MSLSIIESDAFERMERVAKLYVEGVTSPFTIARRLGIKVTEARASLNQWQEILRQDQDSKDAARDALNVMLERYDVLLVEANKTLVLLKDLEFNEKISAQINTTIKTIADLDKVRVDLLQKAGLLDQGDLGDELAEREEREATILAMLRDDLCPMCQANIRDKMTRLQGEVVGDVIDGEVL